MSETIDTEGQTVPWFGTPVGFTMKRKFRRLRRLAGKDQHGRDRAAELAGWYAQMRDLAKQGRTFGEFATDVESFVESYGGCVPDMNDERYLEWFADAASLWQAFIDSKLVRVDGDPQKLAQGFRVTVLDFDETNRPRTSSGRRTPLTIEEKRARDAERKRRERAERKAAFAGMSAERPDLSEDASASALGIGEDRIGQEPTDARVREAVSGLPSVVAEACEQAAVTGIRAEWWQSSIQKLRSRYRSAPDEAFVGAIDWVVNESDGSVLQSKRAWDMLSGAVAKRATTAKPAAPAEPKYRTAAELLAEEERIWGTPA